MIAPTGKQSWMMPWKMIWAVTTVKVIWPKFSRRVQLYLVLIFFLGRALVPRWFKPSTLLCLMLLRRKRREEPETPAKRSMWPIQDFQSHRDWLEFFNPLLLTVYPFLSPSFSNPPHSLSCLCTFSLYPSRSCLIINLEIRNLCLQWWCSPFVPLMFCVISSLYATSTYLLFH